VGSISGRLLTGRWVNLSTGQRIIIRAEQDLIKVKAYRGGWQTFSRLNRNTFVDHRNNRYILNQGSLEYTSQSGDFFMRFSRG
jgi:hypothetical protein